jgi:protein SCO1/2
LHAERIAELQAMVNRTPMLDEVRFVSISTDPERDLPGVIREYGKLHGLDERNWSFLTRLDGAPEEATRRLAEAYGHKFTKSADGYQMHGIVTHVIDRQGIWRGNFHGLKFQPTGAVMFINALTNDVGHRGKDEHAEPGFWGWFRALF